MAQSDIFSEITDEQLKQFAYNEGVSRAVKKRETLIRKIRAIEKFCDEDTLVGTLNAFQAGPNHQIDQPRMEVDNEQQIEGNDADSERKEPEKQTVRVKLVIGGKAQYIDGSQKYVKKAVMHKWMKHSFKNATLEVCEDENGDEQSLTLKHKIQSMSMPEDDENIYKITRLGYEGQKFDTSSKFVRSGVQRTDRQWHTNQVQAEADTLQTRAGKNGSHWLVMSSDTETRARITLQAEAQGKLPCIRRGACSMKGVGEGMDTYFSDERVKSHLDEIWNQWGLIVQILVADCMERLKTDANNNTNIIKNAAVNIGVQQKCLMDKLTNEEITLEEYKEKMSELTQHLMQTGQLGNAQAQ